MQRRDLIKYSGLFVGFTIGAGAFTSVVSSCKKGESAEGESAPDNWTPATLTLESFQLVSLIADTMLPRTKTPSASDLGVDRVVDALLTDWAAPDSRQIFLTGLANFAIQFQEKTGKTFEAASVQERTDYLNARNQEILAAAKTLAPGEKPLPSHQFFLLLKDMIYRGFFTSQQLCEEILVYDPIPGIYKGCTPLADTQGMAYAPI